MCVFCFVLFFLKRYFFFLVICCSSQCSTTSVANDVVFPLSYLLDGAYKICIAANRKSSLCSGGSDFPLSLSDPLPLKACLTSYTLPTSYNRKSNVLNALCVNAMAFNPIKTSATNVDLT